MQDDSKLGSQRRMANLSENAQAIVDVKVNEQKIDCNKSFSKKEQRTVEEGKIIETVSVNTLRAKYQ